MVILGVFQIVFFGTKYILCTKCVHTERYVKMQYECTHNGQKIERGMMDTSRNVHHIGDKLLSFQNSFMG